VYFNICLVRMIALVDDSKVQEKINMFCFMHTKQPRQYQHAVVLLYCLCTLSIAVPTVLVTDFLRVSCAMVVYCSRDEHTPAHLDLVDP